MASLVSRHKFNVQTTGFSMVPEEIPYIVYHIEVEPEDAAESYTIYRRYSEFETLAVHLKDEQGVDWKKSLPKKTYWRYVHSSSFLEQRESKLAGWLDKITADPLVGSSPTVRKFLTKKPNQPPRGYRPISSQTSNPYKDEQLHNKTRADHGKIVHSGWLEKAMSNFGFEKSHLRFFILTDTAIQWWKGVHKESGYDLSSLVINTPNFVKYLQSEHYVLKAFIPLSEVQSVTRSGRKFEIVTGHHTLNSWRSTTESEASKICRHLAQRLQVRKTREVLLGAKEKKMYAIFHKRSIERSAKMNAGLLDYPESISLAEEYLKIQDQVSHLYKQIWLDSGCGDLVDFGFFQKFLTGIHGAELAEALSPHDESDHRDLSVNGVDFAKMYDNPEEKSGDLDQLDSANFSHGEANEISDIGIENGNKMGANPMARNPMAANPMAANPMAANPMARNPMAANPMAANPMAANPMAANPMAGNIPIASNPMATNTMDPNSNEASDEQTWHPVAGNEPSPEETNDISKNNKEITHGTQITSVEDSGVKTSEKGTPGTESPQVEERAVKTNEENAEDIPECQTQTTVDGNAKVDEKTSKNATPVLKEFDIKADVEDFSVQDGLIRNSDSGEIQASDADNEAIEEVADEVEDHMNLQDSIYMDQDDIEDSQTKDVEA